MRVGTSEIAKLTSSYDSVCISSFIHCRLNNQWSGAQRLRQDFIAMTRGVVVVGLAAVAVMRVATSQGALRGGPAVLHHDVRFTDCDLCLLVGHNLHVDTTVVIVSSFVVRSIQPFGHCPWAETISYCRNTVRPLRTGTYCSCTVVFANVSQEYDSKEVLVSQTRGSRYVSL